MSGYPPGTEFCKHPDYLSAEEWDGSSPEPRSYDIKLRDDAALARRPMITSFPLVVAIGVVLLIVAVALSGPLR